MGMRIEEYRRRINTIRASMAGQRLDALLIYSWKRGQVRYLTGYTPNYVANVAAVVLPVDGDPVMFIRFPFDLERAHRACWFDDVRASGDLSGIGRDVARHLRLHSRALRRSFTRLLGPGTARRTVQIDGGLISKRGIGQHAVDTALPLGGDDCFDRSEVDPDFGTRG